MPFIMATVLIDMVALGLIIPVLPALVGTFTGSQADQAFWYGAVSSLDSLMAVVAPVLGAALLGMVSHFPKGDWRIGAPFYFCATLQAAALVLAIGHFRRHPVSG